MHLTPREKEVLNLLLSGHSNKEIAELLRLSTYTVRDHVSALLRKGRVSHRSQLLDSPLPPALVDLSTLHDRYRDIHDAIHL
ncbi:regulatory protein LuxR [Pseudomonas sp. M47T1]|uniref:helix-turn-helix domain-containing protein n=1 Tax=unclassified Pseudomonas TaxID=196821 RepID=UPI0002607F69|nr:helix-turn-helix transcriptional regulator [Pseudomonas sp. M47T1]EIK98148.1 regulatory protein LuxR [Pseudomonas sp. M47T1]